MGVRFSSQRIWNMNVGDYIIGKKRKRDKEDDINQVIEAALRTPKRKKLLSTAKYIYQALFVEGKNSDVTVCALGKEFKLHKVYLCQSPYFASMFGGSWLETTQKYIIIDVVDPLITIESLKVVIGSLYNSEIVIEPMEVVSVLATATMFQLDSLIEKCAEVMMETINPKTAVEYYAASCQYGDKGLQEKCFKWFLWNLMPYYFNHPPSDLKSIPIPLMEKLVADPDLFVVQTEYSIYVMLKYWVYLHVNSEEGDPSINSINEYFASRTGKLPYLLTKEGKCFISVYKGLRLQNLITHELDMHLILKDNIIPRTWLNPVILQQWRSVLSINQNNDKGPTDVSDDVFLETSLRCGRVISVKEGHIWRWTGFHFGMDLLMITNGGTLSIKRNHRTETAQLLSLQDSRHIAIRIRMVRLNEQRQIVYSKQSDILKVALTKGEQIEVMTFDADADNPMLIAVNILYTAPGDVEDQADQKTESYL